MPQDPAGLHGQNETLHKTLSESFNDRNRHHDQRRLDRMLLLWLIMILHLSGKACLFSLKEISETIDPTEREGTIERQDRKDLDRGIHRM